MERVLINFNDGTVGIMQMADPLASDDNIAWAIEKTLWSEDGSKRANSHKRILTADIPNDRSFRNAWVEGEKGPVVDMPKARNIQRDKLRRERETVFTDLDAQYLIADEQGNQALKREIATHKQKLRDVTTDPRIEAAQTPEELKSLTLSVLTQ